MTTDIKELEGMVENQYIKLPAGSNPFEIHTVTYLLLGHLYRDVIDDTENADRFFNTAAHYMNYCQKKSWTHQLRY